MMTTIFDIMPSFRLSRRTLPNLLDDFYTGERYPYMFFDHTDEWIPASDISENDKEYRLTMELPGIDIKGVDISYFEGVITISGEKVKDSNEAESCHSSERYSGSFKRSFRIAGRIDSDGIEATYKDGILKVVLKKSEDSIPKKIEIH